MLGAYVSANRTSGSSYPSILRSLERPHPLTAGRCPKLGISSLDGRKLQSLFDRLERRLLANRIEERSRLRAI